MMSTNPCSSYRMFGSRPEDADRYIAELVEKAIEVGAIGINIQPTITVDFTRPNIGTLVHGLVDELTAKKPTRVKVDKAHKMDEEEFEQLMLTSAMASLEDSDAHFAHERLVSYFTDLLAEYLTAKPGAKKLGPRHWAGNFEQKVGGRNVLVEFEVIGAKEKNAARELTRHIQLSVIPSTEDGTFPNSWDLVIVEIQSLAKEKGIDLSDIDLHKSESVFQLLLNVMQKLRSQNQEEVANEPTKIEK